MVECEFSCISDHLHSNPVLIDTWWNVNDEQILANQGVSSGFNRYMVECESEAFTVYIQNHRVLIDTWWNVNTESICKWFGIQPF